MKKILLIIVTLIASYSFSFSQPEIQWQKCYGGNGEDRAISILQTSDGGYIVGGYSNSKDGDVSGNHGHFDYWILKLDPIGNIQWQRSLGGGQDDFLTSIQQTSDGGYIISGESDSDDGDVKELHGSSDDWLVKLNPNGEIQWQNALGGSSAEQAKSIQQTFDGGYIVAGITCSIDGDVSGNHGMEDAWIVKVDSIGEIQWQKCFGDSLIEDAISIQQTSDSGYVFAGASYSNIRDFSGNHGMQDIWIVKLNSIGDIQWQKILGGSSIEGVHSIRQLKDRGYIIAATTYSIDGDVTGNHGIVNYWIIKLFANGEVEWSKCYGGSNVEEASSVQQTLDGGYIVAGNSNSKDGDVVGNHGDLDYWIIKLSSNEEIQWQKSLGGSHAEFVSSIQQTSDYGYIISGWSGSNDGDVTGNHGVETGNHGRFDFWIVKLSPDSLSMSVPEKNRLSSIEFSIQPNPVHDKLSINIFNNCESNNIIEIYNYQGIRIYSYQGFNNDIQVNTLNFSDGIYYVVLKSRFYTAAKPFVIIK